MKLPTIIKDARNCRLDIQLPWGIGDKVLIPRGRLTYVLEEDEDLPATITEIRYDGESLFATLSIFAHWKLIPTSLWALRDSKDIKPEDYYYTKEIEFPAYRVTEFLEYYEDNIETDSQ